MNKAEVDDFTQRVGEQVKYDWYWNGDMVGNVGVMVVWNTIEFEEQNKRAWAAIFDGCLIVIGEVEI